MDEISDSFIVHCKTNDIETSLQNNWIFVNSIKNPNFTFILQMTLTYLLALMVLRKGTRSNNSEYINAAKNKLSYFFYTRNNPNYQFIISQEKKIDVLMPSPLRQIKFNTLVTSRKNNIGHYQSGDAILEEINKEAERSAIGVPGERQ